jgi:hypothetical protein
VSRLTEISIVSMWALSNRTPYAADHSWVRDREGAEVWLVCVKGTFNINTGGTTTVADKQVEVFLTPKYRGEPVSSSLLYDSDLTRTKVTTDIIVNGFAYAPHERPKRAVSVSFQVGETAKSLRIVGDRVWKAGWFGPWLGLPAPFVKMPIVYERGFGGADLNSKRPIWDRRNPVGTGFAARRSHLIGKRAPNIYTGNGGLSLWPPKPRPAGFGAIASHWSPRVELAGTCDAQWEAERSPLLPEDFDDRFYQCAPSDQQAGRFLRGGEKVKLHNLTSSGYMSFALPRVILGFETDFGARRVSHRAQLHTVILEPDVPRVIMVWHTALPCHADVIKLRRTTIVEKALISHSSQESGEGEPES